MRDKPGILPELIIPVVALAFAAYYVSTVWELPFQARVVGVFVGGGIAILSAALFVRFAYEVYTGRKGLGFNQFFSSPEFEFKRYGLILATVLLLLLMPVFGFALTLFLYVFGTVLMLGGIGRIGVAVAMAAAVTAIAFFVFIWLVRVRFPLSVIDRTILGWIT